MTEQNGPGAGPGVEHAAGPGAGPAADPAAESRDAAGPDARTGGSAGQPGDQSDEAAETPSKSGPPKLNELVDEPAKVMRIGTMIKQLLEEVRNAPLDDAARNRLAEIHDRSLKELCDGLAPELVSELERINLPFLDNATPTDAELRIAQAQLVGWLEGLFRGIQTAIAAQQTANQQLQSRLQLRQLPPGTVLAPGVVIGENGEPRRMAGSTGQSGQGGMGSQAEPQAGPGQYL
ncbi:MULTISPECIES: bacterial proteasome activator family protein [Arthrobacter]|uniref:bacterial proteasome activator family protein n=1 Tax=Arthrobacter TaxID=1663 RepID=UPI0022B1B2BD|nr:MULTISPECIES: bacterial proteasome activator family protein [Arthrobacter]